MSWVSYLCGSVANLRLSLLSLAHCESLRASAPFSSFPKHPQHVTSIIVGRVSHTIHRCRGHILRVYFFCCEDDNELEYSNSSTSEVTSPPLPTTTTWLPYQSSPRNSYSRSKITITKTINHGNGAHHASLTSNYVMETGQSPSISVHVVSTATTADFINDVHRPYLTSPPSEVFPLTGPTFSRPDTLLYSLLFIRTSLHELMSSGCSKFKFSEPSATCPV